MGRPTPLVTYTGPTAAAPGAAITLSATLKTASGAALSGRTLRFTFNGATLNATTNRSGIASVKTKAPATAGAFPVGIAFAGDATYAAATGSASVAVRFATKLTYTGPTRAVRSTPITLSATLKAGSTPVAGKTVTFTFNGSTFTATTNAAGIASVATTAPGTTGSRPITIAFAGDSAYVAASASATLKVT